MEIFAIIIFWSLLGWLFILQPLFQIFLIFRRAKDNEQRLILLLSFLSNVLFIQLFIYSTKFEGAYNFSGHGSHEETPKFLFEGIVFSLVISVITLGFTLYREIARKNDRRQDENTKSTPICPYHCSYVITGTEFIRKNGMPACG